jgi:hypothetical protein
MPKYIAVHAKKRKLFPVVPANATDQVNGLSTPPNRASDQTAAAEHKKPNKRQVGMHHTAEAISLKLRFQTP